MERLNAQIEILDAQDNILTEVRTYGATSFGSKDNKVVVSVEGDRVFVFPPQGTVIDTPIEVGRDWVGKQSKQSRRVTLKSGQEMSVHLDQPLRDLRKSKRVDIQVG